MLDNECCVMMVSYSIQVYYYVSVYVFAHVVMYVMTLYVYTVEQSVLRKLLVNDRQTIYIIGHLDAL